MKTALLSCILVANSQIIAQGTVSEWFPLHVGDQWVYAHETRTGSPKHPFVYTWNTVETITGTLVIPEGTAVLRRIDFPDREEGDGWIGGYGESHYLVRNSCVIFLDSQTWDEKERRLLPEFRTKVLAGKIEPQLCFPLTVGASFGKDSPPGWIPTRVVGRGRGHGYAPASVSKSAFDILVFLDYGDKTHLWFEKGVGITGEWDWHNGTYFEYRVRLLQFRPAKP